MNILRIDTDKISIEDARDIVDEFRKRNIDVIAIPKDVDVLIDCDTATLYWIKEQIEKESAKSTITSLFNEYGKVPAEIYHLVNIALLKSLALKQNVKQITITKNKMAITYYENVDLHKLLQNVNLFPNFKFEKGTLPTISLNSQEHEISSALSYFLQFLGSNIP